MFLSFCFTRLTLCHETRLDEGGASLLCLVYLRVSRRGMELNRVANSVIWLRKELNGMSEPRTATDRMYTDAQCKQSLCNDRPWTHSNYGPISSYHTPLPQGGIEPRAAAGRTQPL